MISKVINNLVSIASPNRSEHFNGETSTAYKVATFLISLITFLVVIVILGLVGQFLWNVSVAGDGKGSGLFTFAKKADNIWQILGLYLLLGLLFGH